MMSEKNMKQNYDEFVNKFKPKKTTDDCYTPEPIYSALRDWVIQEYNLSDREIVRPFWPGGDYEKYIYHEGCVVIDNPPFSILSKIIAFYRERKTDYFLFAPSLTLFGSSGKNKDWVKYIVTNTDITYENGAIVNTSFVTNLGNYFIRTAPKLKRTLEEANNTDTEALPKYKCPSTVISAAMLGKYSRIEFNLDASECEFVRVLDSQRSAKKVIFGGGFFISPNKAAELQNKADELRADKLQADKLQADKPAITWELSEREREIIERL